MGGANMTADAPIIASHPTLVARWGEHDLSFVEAEAAHDSDRALTFAPIAP